ncbi:zinc finger protein 276-like isoform X2 [Polyodon spathula]|uniref:zinc finger protein 276-like isoform X2 n=1 Tax=Polyodon spathula TaxID=7913 RepID=UPI001B7F166D|nr:zinc finger protein 276-like isoform X2 [Polyodon spathula]
MMKRDRRGRFRALVQETQLGQQAAERKPGGRRGRPRSSEIQHTEESLDPSAVVGGAEGGSEESGTGRTVTTAFCRLCHGKFSSRSLRSAFGKIPVIGQGPKKKQKQQVFFADFQRLLGVPVMQDPVLSQFICKNCYTQFYKCSSILRTFIQRVNMSPTGRVRGNSLSINSDSENSSFGDLITSSPGCLHSLVSWAHQHAGSCQSSPSLQEVMASEYCGVVRAVWACGDGHNYVMDTDSDRTPQGLHSAKEAVKPEGGEGLGKTASGNSSTEHGRQPQLATTEPCSSDCQKSIYPSATTLVTNAGTPRNQNASHHHIESNKNAHESPVDSIEGQLSSKEVLSSVPPGEALDGEEEDSDLSDSSNLILSSDDEDEEKTKSGSSDELFEPYPEKNKVSSKKSESKEAKKKTEPKVRKKPGPKPGWKKKIKSESYREELPTIYKCPYQGCTAVYRGSDGMKKHIKEHHEEVRERPCPHPGCNKVFMIDRYLQRHVKLIHTEVRNYICDECGQTFKQRKHLSVHQMRHSGAKPLQCEVCGFQCRQRASLKYHMTKHKAEAELDFACDQCGKRFEKAHNLNVHMSMVHPLTQNSDKKKSYGIVQLLQPGDAQGMPETLTEPLIQGTTS